MKDSIINDVRIRKILDSRGGFTVEATVSSGRLSETAMVANSTSTGSHEVFAFPGGDVDRGIANFDRVKRDLVGVDSEDQAEVDRILHKIGGERLGFIGGNVSTGVSVASAKLAARANGLELYEYIFSNFTKGHGIKKSVPRPLGNLIGGGVHSNDKMSIQEILISADSGNFMNNAYINGRVHRALGDHLSRSLKIATGVNIEGAWVTGFGDKENLGLGKRFCDEEGTISECKIDIGADFAASEFYRDGEYVYLDSKFSSSGHVEFVEKLAGEFGRSVLEDPMREDDFRGFAEITKRIGSNSLIIGDDLYTTNVERLKKGIANKSTNAVLIKVNQIGTLSDTMAVVMLAHENGMDTVVSHRSRETIDSFIAHLAVAFGSKFIKTGIVGGERVSKLNELARIESLESKA